MIRYLLYHMQKLCFFDKSLHTNCKASLICLNQIIPVMLYAIDRNLPDFWMNPPWDLNVKVGISAYG